MVDRNEMKGDWMVIGIYRHRGDTVRVIAETSGGDLKRVIIQRKAGMTWKTGQSFEVDIDD